PVGSGVSILDGSYEPGTSVRMPHPANPEFGYPDAARPGVFDAISMETQYFGSSHWRLIFMMSVDVRMRSADTGPPLDPDQFWA
ncbi:hypothetical protein, partial [Frankia sp. Cr1]|uniref:hypothetical protein n=1 Tax=Frankia sp. Cr1 TaxID=3073931 RepID=UPI002AD4B47B